MIVNIVLQNSAFRTVCNYLWWKPKLHYY